MFDCGFVTSGTVNINGKVFTGNDVNISSDGNNICVNGERVDGISKSVRAINITVNGDCEHLTTTNGDIEADDVVNLETVNGDVECNDVVSVTTVNGDVHVSGSCGGAKTVSGDIYGGM